MCKLPDGRDWSSEKLDLALVGKAVLSNYLLTNGVVCPSCQLFSLRLPSAEVYGFYGRDSSDLQEDFHQEAPSRTAVASAPIPTASCCCPIPQQDTLQYQQVDLVQSSVGSLMLSLGLGVHKILFVPSRSGICLPQSCGSPIVKSCWPSTSDSLGIPSLFVESPGRKVLCRAQNVHKSRRTSLVLLFSSLCITYAAVILLLVLSSAFFFFLSAIVLFIDDACPLFLLEK